MKKQETVPASIKTVLANAKLAEHSLATFAIILKSQEFSNEFLQDFYKVIDNFNEKIHRLADRAQKEVDSKKKNESRQVEQEPEPE